MSAVAILRKCCGLSDSQRPGLAFHNREIHPSRTMLAIISDRPYSRYLRSKQARNRSIVIAPPTRLTSFITEERPKQDV